MLQAITLDILFALMCLLWKEPIKRLCYFYSTYTMVYCTVDPTCSQHNYSLENYNALYSIENFDYISILNSRVSIS